MTAAQETPIPANPLASVFGNPQMLENPYPFYAMLRAANPVLRAPIPDTGADGLWVLTRHRDVEATLRSKAVSVQRERAMLVRRFSEMLPPIVREQTGPRQMRHMLVLDGADHQRMRGLVNKAFTPRRVAELAPRIEAVLAECLERMADAGGPVNLMSELAEPVPAVVIADLLGVPAEDHRQFKTWSADLINQLGPRPEGGFDTTSLDKILDYLQRIIAERRKAPADDLISAMIAAQEERDALTDPELLANSFLLLLAGHETTTNLIGNGMLALLRNPDQLARLHAQPELVPNAIEELLRYDSPVQMTVRIPIEEIEIDGHRIAKDAMVACVIGAANRDPEVFDEPDRLDVTRPDPRHLSFGFGQHFCLGANLARLEGRLSFAALLSRFPRIELAGDPVHRPNPFLRGLSDLPIEVS